MIAVVDIICIVTGLLALYFGVRQGLARQLATALAVIGTLLFTALVYGKLAVLSASAEMRMLILAVLMLAVALTAYSGALVLGSWLERRWLLLRQGSLRGVDMLGAGLFVVVSAGLIVWTTSLFVTAIPSEVVRRELDRSVVLASLDRSARAVPWLRQTAATLQPFAAPAVFAADEPQFTTAVAASTQPQASLDEAITQARPSVLKVTAWGCGSSAVGSGFIMGTREVMTNAHVVMGADRISVQLDGDLYPVSPVWFDPALDVAVLRSDVALPASALRITAKELAAGSTAAVLGYPGGAGLQTAKAPVIQQINAVGYDIYKTRQTTRSIYALHTTVVPGSSGGPVVTADGQVAGMIFGDSATQAQTAYAIAGDQLAVVARQAAASQKVSTGGCAGAE